MTSEARGETNKELNPDQQRKSSYKIGDDGQGYPPESGPVEPPVINPRKSEPLTDEQPEPLKREQQPKRRP
jgi:hypothetical protein